jgi:hypothetical protein
MHKYCRIAVNRALLAGICLLAAVSLQAQTSVRRVQVLGSKDAVEIEVEASDRVVPQTQVLTGPDRLVVDFPNAVPSKDLRSQSVYRGQVKDLRVGLFQARPPVTRIVLDLNSAQSYQVFPGRTVIIKVMGGTSDTSAKFSDYAPAPTTRPGLVVANYVSRSERVSVDPVSQKPLEVSFRDGLLAIHSNKATLSEVLFAVQQRTGAEVAIAAGAEQEKVVVELGPAPAPEVLASLLNGSKFNFLILSAADDPRKLDRVILSPRVESAVQPLSPVVQNDDADDDEPPPQPAPVQGQMNVPPPPAPVQMAPKPQPEIVPAQDNTPDQ